MSIDRRDFLLGAAIALQVVSWFDVQGLIQRVLPLAPLTPLQHAQAVGGFVLFVVWWASKPDKPISHA